MHHLDEGPLPVHNTVIIKVVLKRMPFACIVLYHPVEHDSPQ